MPIPISQYIAARLGSLYRHVDESDVRRTTAPVTSLYAWLIALIRH